MFSTDAGPDPRWERFVEREPYFAVLTSPKYLRAHLTNASEREFFESGEEFVDWALTTIDLRLVPHFAPVSVLEFGCGVGRLAIPFARRPGSVTAVDRSAAMLTFARDAAQRQGVTHIRFQTPAELFASGRKFDLVNCYHVFQRMPQSDGLTLLRELIRSIGSGGIGVFQFPYQTTAPRLTETVRWTRERVQTFNGFLNLARNKPFHQPFIPTHTYDLDTILRVFADFAVQSTHIVFEHEPGFAAAICFVHAALPAAVATRDSTSPSPSRGGESKEMIQTRQIVDGSSIDDLNRKAEEYFASLTQWEHHLAKPFSNADETPTLLMNLAAMLQGLKLAPGAVVLEFGAGTGWLSRFLTQLGCRVILLDVSPTALRIARELYERVPIVGERPAPQFLLFDGRRIEVPDASVDRIVSFDAFHHVSNPDAILREFARVLKPGGIAGFAEPGPRHSCTPSSQFEMRTYGVVESDIDIHAIWRTAQGCGFRDIRISVFHGSPFHVSLDDYEDFLTGGATSAKWVESTRGFLRHVRHFFLIKEGVESLDSRQLQGLSCSIRAIPAPPTPVDRQPVVIEVSVTNTGSAVWLPADAPHGGVLLGAHLYDEVGKLLTFNALSEPLAVPPREINPGETVKLVLRIATQPAGRYLLELDCVAGGVTWFAKSGSQPAILPIEITT